MYYNQDFGAFGEELATEYLLKENYKIITKNFSCYFGELDIIARDINKNELVFVEVKTRKSAVYGSPAEAVGFYKQKHISKCAKYFIHIYHLEKEFIRFDVIEVFLDKKNAHFINHIKQAF